MMRPCTRDSVITRLIPLNNNACKKENVKSVAWMDGGHQLLRLMFDPVRLLVAKSPLG